MNKLLLLFVLGVFLFSCSETEKPDGYLINGKITGAADMHLILQTRVDGEFVDIDTAATDPEGNFLFEGKVENPELYYIKVEERKYVSFFIENSEIELNAHIDSLKTATVKGSLIQDNYDGYLSKTKKFRDKSEALYEEYKVAKEAEDEVKLAEINKKFEVLENKTKDFNLKYVKENAKSIVSAYIAFKNAYNINLDELKDVVNAFDSTLTETKYVKYLNERISILEKTAIGQAATDFTQNDPEGNPITLSSFKGKYLLVDFWASWCGPCRKENPNVVKLYEKYHEKGFEILGVSFDKEKDAWLKAIEDDSMVWNHVSDLKYWNNAAGKIYGIRSIPHTMLINREGKIIAHKINCEELETKLEELLKAEQEAETK